MLCKRRLLAPPQAADLLRRQLATHMRRHQAVYGTRLLRPKHHWMMDVPEQVARDNTVLDAFIVERIHLQVKWIAEFVKNTSTFELSVLSGVTNCAFRRAREAMQVFGGLVGRTAPLPGFAGALVADHLEHGGMKVSSDDVVISGPKTGKVVACLREGSKLFVLVEAWRRVAVVSEHSDKWLRDDARELWATTSICLPLAWYTSGDGSTVVARM